METLKLGNRWRKCCSAAHVLLAGCCNSASFFALMEKSGSTNVHFPSFEFYFRLWNFVSIQTQISAFRWTRQGLHEDVSLLRNPNSPNPNNANNPNPNNPCFYPSYPPPTPNPRQRSRLCFLFSILIVAPALHFPSIPHSSSSCLCQSAASRNSSPGSAVSEVDSASSALSRFSQMKHEVAAHNNPSAIHP